MADVFFNRDATKLLKNKHIVIFGDSNARALYKDLVWLLNHNTLIDNADLRRKQEESFSGDKLGKHTELIRGREYEEERSFEKDGTQVDFYFITRCYNAVMVDMMEDIHMELRKAPDIIYISSTFWDVCRWGPNGVTQFKDNLLKLARLFKSSLPVSTLVIWATALPVSSKVRSSLLIKQIDFLGHTLRFDVMEANQFARQVMVEHGFDVLDNHFHMRMQVHRRVSDGVHYFPVAIRLLTNLLLTHIALSWDFPLPNRVSTILLDKAKRDCGPDISSPTPKLKSPPVPAKPKKKPPPSKPQAANEGKKPKPTPSDTPPRRTGPKFNKKNKARNRNNYRLHETLHNPQRRKKNIDHRSANNWSSDVRSWNTTSPNMHNTGDFSQQWINNFEQTDWAEDHWPNGQRFSHETRFGHNYRQFNNTLAQGLMLHNQLNMLSKSGLQSGLRKRYAPY